MSMSASGHRDLREEATSHGAPPPPSLEGVAFAAGMLPNSHSTGTLPSPEDLKYEPPPPPPHEQHQQQQHSPSRAALTSGAPGESGARDDAAIHAAAAAAASITPSQLDERRARGEGVPAAVSSAAAASAAPAASLAPSSSSAALPSDAPAFGIAPLPPPPPPPQPALPPTSVPSSAAGGQHPHPHHHHHHHPKAAAAPASQAVFVLPPPSSRKAGGSVIAPIVFPEAAGVSLLQQQQQQPLSPLHGAGGGGGSHLPTNKGRSHSWSYSSSAVPSSGSPLGGGGGMQIPPMYMAANAPSISPAALHAAAPFLQPLHQHQRHPRPSQSAGASVMPPSQSFGLMPESMLPSPQGGAQPMASTPPLPTTPSAFIRRTSLPHTYLHTIPIGRPSPLTSPSDSSSYDMLKSSQQPTNTEASPLIEIPTQGARALPKDIASHPAIRSLTRSSGDQTSSDETADASEKDSNPEQQAADVGPPIPIKLEESGPAGEGKFVDISEYLNLPQSKVAKTLGIPSSTLSKRWKEAARARKWPWRTVCKIDKEIMALLHNIPPSLTAKGPEHVPPEIRTRLITLLRQRQDELKPVIIRL